MTGSVVLDVIVGLFVVYFIVSSMASVISEMIAMFVGRRSNTMAQFILDMFKETNPAPPAAGTAARVTATPPIAYPNTFKFYNSSIFDMNDVGGLLGVITTVGNVIGAWLHQRGIGSPPVPGSEKVLSISTNNFSQAVFEVLNIATGNDHLATLQNLKNIINDVSANALLKDSPLRSALLTSIQQADDSVEKVAANLAKWFDGQMTQLSDYYKRRTRVILFFIGIVLAFSLNVDSVAIFHALQNNPTLRQLAVQQAEVITSQTPQTPGTSPDVLKQQLIDLNKQLNDLAGLPIGFMTIFNTPDWGSSLIGILITSIAVALGAQFWFDVLKLLTTRSAAASN